MSYRVRPGDTLTTIAARHHTTVAKLAKANGIKNVNRIYAGQVLRVDGFTAAPAKKKAPAKAAPKANVGGGNAAKRKALASVGRQVAMSMGGYRSRGLCATGVSRTIQRVYGIKVWGNGNQIDNNLPRSKFKQVNMSLAQALKTPGLILTWERTSTPAGRKYGHTAITLGDGRGSVSDFVERNTLGAGGRSGFKVFMPI